MKNQIRTLLTAVSLLAAAGTSHAMSHLISLSEIPVWPATSTPNGDLVYTVTTVGRGGSGMLEITLTAGDLPPGVTVTFSPSTLRFTGNQATSQISTMTVSCQGLVPLDCYPFTITGTAQRESMTITNFVYFTPPALAVRLPTLFLDKLDGNALWLRGEGATGKIYQIEASPTIDHPVWTNIGSTTADANGRFTFFTSQTVPMRFFRAVTTPEPVVTP